MGTVVRTRRGVVRNVVVLWDVSRAEKERDFRPSRLEATKRILDNFISEFCDQNPLSSMALITTSNKLATKLTEFSANAQQLTSKLKDISPTDGVPSFQNALEVARHMLASAPSYCSKEIMLICASLTTADPGDIFSTISSMAQEQIRISVVSLSAEVRVCRLMADKTGGAFGVALDADHLRALIFAHITPPPTVSEKAEASLVRMAFPRQVTSHIPLPCACHERFTTSAYVCPRCASRCCELPGECAVCGVMLILSSHLARSYHHLFPLPAFAPPTGDTMAEARCVSCRQDAGAGAVLCPRCSHTFCSVCDQFIHAELHVCPGCEGATA